MNNFWTTLPKPFFVLAPMDDVTDTVFRQIVASCAAPDVFVTEFTSVDAFWSAGRTAVERKLRITPGEQRPLVAQIWGTNPDHFLRMAEELVRMDYDGIDINMGCPVKDVMKRGACSALIDQPQLASEIIQATKQGAGHLPVSVKTRIGTRKIVTESWVQAVLEQDIASLAVHGRTSAEMSKVPAHWDEIGKAVQVRNAIAPQTIMIGNGDVISHDQGEHLARQYGLDGIMIGRGVFANPYIFAKTQDHHTPGEMVAVLLKHLNLYEATWGNAKNFNVLKRFFKIYINGFDGASQIRQRLMEAHNGDEVRTIMSEEFPAIAR